MTFTLTPTHNAECRRAAGRPRRAGDRRVERDRPGDRAGACARAGADVALTYRANEDGARDVEREIQALGRRAAVIQLDLADDASVRALGPSARDALGRLDVWVNNAGADILTGAGASLSDVEKLDLLLAVDLRGTMLASWQAAEMLGAQPSRAASSST